jgi:UDP-glucose 4-epimerase
MKIALTGPAGLIGSWISEKLLEQGHKVVSFENFIGGYPDSVIQHPNHSLLTLDITDIDEVETMAQEMMGCDVVYHTAALAHEGYSVFAPASISNSVFTGTVNVATAAIKAGVKRFINCSSMSRYGDQESPFTEDMRTCPVDPYALAKVAAEDQLNLLAKLHGLEVIHTVPHNVIGPRQRYTDPFRNVISIWVNLILQGRSPVVYGGGQTRCFSMIQDDVNLFIKLLDYDLRENGEIFNIGPDDREISLLDLAYLVINIMGSNVEPEIVPYRPFEVKRPICSSNKIREKFGFKPTITLEEGIKSIVNYIRNRGAMSFDYHVQLEIDNKDNIPKTWKEKLF